MAKGCDGNKINRKDILWWLEGNLRRGNFGVHVMKAHLF